MTRHGGRRSTRSQVRPRSADSGRQSAIAGPGRASRRRPGHTSATRRHWCEGRRRELPRCRWAAARPEQARAPQAPPDWRPPRGLRGRDELQDDAPATRQRPSPTGVEGAGGSCRGAGGRWRGTRTKHRPIGGRRVACGAWPGFETTRRAGGQATRRPEIRRRPGTTAPGKPTGPRVVEMGGIEPPSQGIAKGAGISRPLARVPSLIHEGHLDATHQ